MNKNKFVYISDNFLYETVGGGELNDDELLLLLEQRGALISKMRSSTVTVDILKKERESNFIVSNFVNLSESSKEYLVASCSYIIYEHDHKYLRNRNPAFYKDFIAPKSEIINVPFYKNAKAVFCQSSFHRNLVEKNIDIDNIVVVSGNLWSENSLAIMRILNRKGKRDCYSVLNSRILHKNTRNTMFYCEKKQYDFQLIQSSNYEEFLTFLSNNDKFIFLPKTPETLSRVVVEARMMGLKVITNKNVGAIYEPWFNLKGEELINIMIDKRKTIPDKVMRVFYEE